MKQADVSLFEMAKKTIKNYFKTVDTFTKDLLATIQCPSVQAVREELKVIQEHTDGKWGEYQKISPTKPGSHSTLPGMVSVLFCTTSRVPDCSLAQRKALFMGGIMCIAQNYCHD